MNESIIQTQSVQAAAKAEISRINGAKSRGPITEKGKEISRMNALKCGFYSTAEIVLPTEDKEHFERFRESHFEELAPKSEREAEIVEKIVVYSWRLRRVAILECNLLDWTAIAAAEPTTSILASIDRICKLDRHEGRLDRLLKEAKEELRTCQDDRGMIELNTDPHSFNGSLGSYMATRNRGNEPSDFENELIQECKNEPRSNLSPGFLATKNREEPRSITTAESIRRQVAALQKSKPKPWPQKRR